MSSLASTLTRSIDWISRIVSPALAKSWALFNSRTTRPFCSLTIQYRLCCVSADLYSPSVLMSSFSEFIWFSTYRAHSDCCWRNSLTESAPLVRRGRICSSKSDWSLAASVEAVSARVMAGIIALYCIFCV